MLVLGVADEVLVNVVEVIEVAVQVAKDESIRLDIGEDHGLSAEEGNRLSTEHRDDEGQVIPKHVVQLLVTLTQRITVLGEVVVSVHVMHHKVNQLVRVDVSIEVAHVSLGTLRQLHKELLGTAR